ncbi:MAG TPA: hypothetical protein PKD54_02245 [Pirellulaceae bacterium]|nr:hypothetical protein [Pirellulaceae bacterium]
MLNHSPLPQLSAAKPRVGLQSLEDLVRSLIVQYQFQAQVRAQLQCDPYSRASAPVPPAISVPAQQRHFDWYSPSA